MERSEILQRNPIEKQMRTYGIEPAKKTATGFMVKCPFHEDKNPSMSVDTTSNLFFCHGCGAKGSVIDFIMRKENLSLSEVMHRLDPEGKKVETKPDPATNPPPNSKLVATYSYKDELGNELYQVCRMEPKDFRQRHSVDGKWVWNMQGVRRVLYNLPAILKSKNPHVWIVEGEKDADNLKKCGFVATCNVGGAGKWMDGYTECLAGKEIIMCGDNDAAGEKHVRTVIDAICKTVKSIHHVRIPSPHKDASDFIATFPDYESAARGLFELYEDAPVLSKGVVVPVKTMGELERDYQRALSDQANSCFSLGSWIPSLGNSTRPLTSGDLVSFIAGTSVGKTAILQNIAICSRPIPTLFFEIELSEEVMFERLVSLSSNITAYQVEVAYKNNQPPSWKTEGKMNHLNICPKSRITTEEIETIINQTELKVGIRPKLVLIDYIGLVQGKGMSRYERTSNVAEELKSVAKSTRTAIIVASQISRKKHDDSPEVTISDAKDSGSIENSSGLLIGCWRDSDNPTELSLRILKNTRGPVGRTIRARFNPDTLAITDIPVIDPCDVPSQDDVPVPYADT